MLPPGINSRESFFDAVRSNLPVDPPLVGSRSWEALSDSLWQGLFATDADMMVIAWRDSGTMTLHAPGDYELAIDVLGHVASTLADPRATQGKPRQLSVYVA